MGKSQSTRVALIGAGPRGTSALERLLANWAAEGRDALPGRTLQIDVVDPYPAGPGHVWQPGQSRLYLMNTQSFYPTVIPEDPQMAPPLAGGTFEAWRRDRREDGKGLSADEAAELASLESRHFPSRAIYGRYLSSTLAELLAHLPAGVTVAFHETTAVSVQRRGPGFDVELATGDSIPADAVVLSLGHLGCGLNSEQKSFRQAAERLGLKYFPPAVPADVDWSGVPGNEPVLVRGMGLNFFDVVGQLTEGRGGKFVESGSRLEYLPSGTEPLIIAASRRGTPYRTKADLDLYYARRVRLRYLTEDAVRRFPTAGIQPGFDHDLWPLLHRDVLWSYYSTLVGVEPAAVQNHRQFMAELESALRPHSHRAGHWEAAVAKVVRLHVAPEFVLDLAGLPAPLAGRSFASRAELDAAIVDYLDDDARRSLLGEADPVKMAIAALHTGRAVLKAAVADGGITEESWVGELRGWFDGFIEGLASGPPAMRGLQLAALARAGIVGFVGPDPKFSVDRLAGMFTAASPWVRDRPVAARTMVEALAPPNHLALCKSDLVRQLLADGLVRIKLMMTIEGTPVQTSGLDVVPHPYRAVGASGAVTPGLYILGLQLSSAQWGTAIAAQALPSEGPAYRSGQRSLRDADEIARHILGITTR